ncbi:hypothetical protein FA15DRAFT_756351 [Coprinopsis marcescibilis]|uniref:DUF6533 domain-containing protein n=1 Tax=Coprinopsis marcescibilis TaxID=230819 RepID=A0A5C3KXV6_COPMA|nr:hypothetical protein FA15DRAFT_756351 [Coprinopsis marcescibilis]
MNSWAEDGQLSRYFTVSACTILLLDYMHTFPLEVKLVWYARWRPAKLGFIFTRYIVVAFLASHSAALFATFPSQKWYRNSDIVILALWMTSSLSAEVLLCYQVYAFSQRATYAGVYLTCQFSVYLAATLLCIAKLSSESEAIPRSSDMDGTALYVHNSDSTIISLTLFITNQKYRKLNSTLVRIFLWSGLTCWCSILVMCTANAILTFRPTTPYPTTFLAAPLAVTRSTLSTRMILVLRQASRQNMLFDGSSSGDAEEADLPPIRFR